MACVVGIGPYSAVIIELAEICGYNITSLLHYDNSKDGDFFHGIKIEGSYNDPDVCKNVVSGHPVFLSMGSSKVRLDAAEWLKRNGAIFPNLIHPDAEISRSAKIGEGVIIKKGACIQACSEVKDYSVVCDNSIICHHSVLEDGCFVAGLTVIGAYTNLGRCVFVGQGAVIPSGKVSHVGENTVIGAGAVVTKSLGSGKIFAGNPAKEIK